MGNEIDEADSTKESNAKSTDSLEAVQNRILLDNSDLKDADNDATSSSGDEDDDDEEEIEDPPILKYTRLTQLPKVFFSKELVTSSLIHEQVFAFGTASGIIYMTSPSLVPIGTIRARKSPVLCIHTDGQYVAAASMDGTIVITSIKQLQDSSGGNGTNQAGTAAFDIKTPIYSVVLSGNYKDTRSFVYGKKNGQIVLSHTNWLGSRTEKVLGQDSGPIVSLQIVGEVLFWMSDDGITAYNLLSESVILNIERPQNSPPAELVWPKINYQEHDRMLIGWVNHIWSIKINSSLPKTESNFKLTSAMSSFSKATSEPSVVVEFENEIDSLITGIASFKDDCILVLTVSIGYESMKPDEKEPPELRIFNPISQEEISTDEVMLKGYKALRINDYHLGQYMGSNKFKYYIVCSTDGIIVEELDLMGQFSWYMERDKFLEVYEISENLISKTERCNIGIKQVELYLQDENWLQATNFLQRVLTVGENDTQEYKDFIAEKWEQWSWILIHSNQSQKLAEILPKISEIQLPKGIYNKCLEIFLATDENLFFQYLHEWDIELYDVKTIESLLEHELDIDPDKNVLRRCLAELYIKTDEPSLAVKHFIILNDTNTIDLLSKHHLIAEFFESLPDIIKFEVSSEDLNLAPVYVLKEKLSKIINLLVQSRHEILPSKVVSLMNKHNMRVVAFLYLQEVSQVDPFSAETFETEMVELYAEFDRSHLLPYLKKNSHYNIDEALKIMHEKTYNQELVFLLGKVGRAREAMLLIINSMDDPKQAVEFAQEQKKPELWDLLLENGITKPNFIKVLIEYTGILFDPQVLEKIPEGVEIEGLKDSLVKITLDNEVTICIQKEILNIVQKEAIQVSDKLNQLRIQGRVIYSDENLEVS